MSHSWAILQEVLLSSMSRVYMLMFLILVERQKVFFQLILRMQLELVFIILLYPFIFFLSKVKGHDTEFGIYLSNISCSVGLWENTKVEVKKGTALICQACRSVISLNIVAFTQNSVGNVLADLLAIQNTFNVKKTKNLLCFIFYNTRKNKVFSRITNFVKRKSSQLAFLDNPIYSFFLKLLQKYY